MRHGIDRGNNEAVAKDMMLIILGASILILWCFFTLCRRNLEKSRTFMAATGVVSVGISYLACIAVGTAMGIKGTIVTSLLPFFLLGIGVDDMYVLIFYLEQTDPMMTGREKMSKMMKNAGLSVTITSITNCISFSMGIFSSMIAIRDFCVYAVLGLLLDYIY